VIAQVEKAADVRVLVFQAEGRTFIAGADIHELKALTPETSLALAREGFAVDRKLAPLQGSLSGMAT